MKKHGNNGSYTLIYHLFYVDFIQIPNKTVIGSMALLDIEKWAKGGEWPIVARIQEVNEEENTSLVKWFEKKRGSKLVFHEAYTVGSNRRRVEMLAEIVPNDQIFFSGFQLTRTGRLPKIALDALKNHEDKRK